MLRLGLRATWIIGTNLRTKLQWPLCERHSILALRIAMRGYRPTMALNCSEKHWALYELVSQGQYEKALSMWEQERYLGQAGPSLYLVIMWLCERMGNAEIARAVRDDMLGQGWSMDRSCSVHFIRALLSEGLAEEALQFVMTSDLKDDEKFLSEAAMAFSEGGHHHEALATCQSGRGPALQAVELEVWGAKKQLGAMEDLVRKHNGGDLSTAPTEVQLAMADGLSLAERPKRALGVLHRLHKSSAAIPVKSVALILESAQRQEDFQTAAKVDALLWKNYCQFRENSVSEHWGEVENPLQAPEQELSVRSDFLLRAINAAIHLQAIALRDIQATKSKVSEEVQAFLNHNFFHQIRDECLLPDTRTYEAALLLSCFSEDLTGSMMDRVLKSCVHSGQRLSPESFTRWTKFSGPLYPQQSLKVWRWVRVHSTLHKVSLGLEQFADLLSIKFHMKGDVKLQKDALAFVRMIGSFMRSKDILTTPEAFHLILEAVIRLRPHFRSVYTAFKDMLQQGVNPNLQTFHILVDGCLTDGTLKSTEGAVYNIWRDLVKEHPRIQPDIDLMNKLIECCMVCRDFERAFFFLGVLNDYDLHPNLETFRKLLKICRAANDQERFKVIVKLATNCLPEQSAAVSSLVASIEQEWKMEEDVSLARDLLSHIETRPSGT